MKKKWIMVVFLFAFLFVFLIASFISAEMTVSEQPYEIYNLEDTLTTSVTIDSSEGTSGMFSMTLLCGNKQIVIFTESVNIAAGEEKIMETSLYLIKNVIGDSIGICKIKSTLLGEAYTLTKDFEISSNIILQPNIGATKFEPGESIIISGEATKENGQKANGFIDLEIIVDDSSNNIIKTGVINNGIYSMNVTLPKNIAAGNYLVKLNAYETNSEKDKTNNGYVNYNIAIKQIPTYLELLLETDQVEPGTSVKVKAILHDQTGEKIDSSAIITIKRGTTDIQIQSEEATGTYFEFPIAYNEPAANWTIFALSNQLSREITFVITEKAAVEVAITNSTVTFTNKGNVVYNETVIVKIGEESIGVPILLNVNEAQEYELKAPNGQYTVEVLNGNGESQLSKIVPLTGKSIEIKNLSQSSFKEIIETPFVWIFIIFVFAAVVFILMKRAKTPKFSSGSLFKKKIKQPKINAAWENRAVPLSKNSKLETKNKAIFAPSIKGNKQEVSIVNIKIKNLGEIQNKNGNAEEPLQKIINIAESKKAFVYENQENLFFIISPSKTRTLQNESIALEIAQGAKEILSDHNRISKFKLNFGISLEYGSIVERTDKGIMEFMMLENLLNNAKKIASVSKEDILLGEKIKLRLTSVRTEKKENERIPCYKIKEMKYHDEEHSRFIKSFLKKAEEKKGQI